MLKPLVLGVIACAFLLGCQPELEQAIGRSTIEPTVSKKSLKPLDADFCMGAFVTHELDHITKNAYEPVDMYDSNGAGLAVNDLDNDGDNDIVLANLNGKNSLFWNDGDLNFRKVEFPHGSSRAVAIVDVDADGLLDIVFTTRVGRLSYFRNLADGSDFPFEKGSLDGVTRQSYAMAWDDLDGDGDLDLVTGSYDTALERELRDSFLFGDGAGVVYYENDNGKFIENRLAEASQALAIQLLDLDGDDRKDILVGNDFGSVRDFVFLNKKSGWEQAEPLNTTTENTMSFDMGDVDNDGIQELFAADMMPYAESPLFDAAWGPVFALMDANRNLQDDDPQVRANVLLTNQPTNTFTDQAKERSIQNTGWSWSSKFGDLDQDGWLDLYVVNGMISAETFAHLPNNELVEQNQVRRNTSGNFEAEDWGLGLQGSGRGMSMTDLDGDGDLDIIINNLLEKATVLENQLCTGHSLLVDLRWENSSNPFAIGSIVTVEADDLVLTRDVRVISGYLSGDPTQLHFGIPSDTKNITIKVEWPDGETSVITNQLTNHQLTITR